MKMYKRGQNGEFNITGMVAAFLGVAVIVLLVPIMSMGTGQIDEARAATTLQNLGYELYKPGSGVFAPSSNNTVSLGDASHYFSDAYIINLHPAAGGTGTITGSGTAKYVPVFNSATAVQNSTIVDNATGTFIPSTLYARTGRAATYVVAAVDATAIEKAQADYVCDGVSDQVQIQDALNALPAIGGSVYLSSGNYYINATITLPAKSWHISGTGQESTYLRLVALSNCDMFAYTSATTDISFVSMEKMTLNGVGQSGASTLININPGGGHHVWDATWRELLILNAYTTGFYTTDAHDYIFDHVIVEYCGQSAANWIPAIQLASGSNAYFVNCLIKLNNARGVACGAYGSTFVNTVFSANGEVGLLLYADDCAVTNCVFENNGYLAVGTYASLWMVNDREHVVSNSFYANDNRPKYCIQIDGGSDNNIVSGNTLYGYTTAALLNNGTATIRSNKNYVTENSGANVSTTNGTYIAHGLVTTPTIVLATGSILGEIISVISENTTHFQTAVIKHDGTAGTSQTVYWRASYGAGN